MAKTKPQAEERRPVTHRADPERWNRIIIVGAVVAALLVAVGFIGYGLYIDRFKPLDKTVLRVEDVKFNLAHLERRMELELRENFFYAQAAPQQQLIVADIVYQRLEREAKLLAGSEELNITASDEDVAAEIRFLGNLAEEASPEVVGSALSQQLANNGLEVNEYQQMLRAQILDQKVREYFAYLAPQSEQQVHARWIRLDTVEGAEAVLERLEAGEDFATLAREESEDTGTAEEGGDLGWRPRGAFPARDMEDFLLDDAELGEYSGIFSTPVGFYIVELLERDEDRELDESLRRTVAAREMAEWLLSLDDALDIERDFTAEDRDRALRDVIL